MTNTNNPSYLVYAGILVSALAHFGFIISQNDAVAVVAGAVVLIGAIWAHYTTKTVVASAKAAGVQGLK